MVMLVEVGPRDGLQIEPTILPTEDKLRFVEQSAAAGIRRIEVTSFVNPKLVPQMADAEDLMARLPRDGRASYIGLVLNRRGYERASAVDVDEIGAVVVASDTFALRNQGVTSAQSVESWVEIGRLAKAEGRKASVTIAAAFGCPYEGEVAAGRVVEMAEQCLEGEPFEIALADSIGCADPRRVTNLVSRVKAVAPGLQVRIHLHNTRNTGLANAYAAVEAGADALDASTGGIGGCPFAPRATGNIPMEDLVYMLERMGMRTGVDIDQVIETARWLEDRIARPLPAMLGKAGIFPPRRGPADTN